MRQKATLAFILLFVFSMAIIGGCAQQTTPPPQPPPPEEPEPQQPGDTEEPLGEPFKIGFLNPLTGGFAANGIDQRDGLLMYLDEHDWVLANRPIEVIHEDTEGNPATALVKTRKLVEMDKVDLIVGGLLASEGYAIAEYCRNNNFPYLVSTVSADDLAQRLHSDYVIKTGWSSSQPMHIMAEYAYNTLGYRKVAAIAYDFAFGHETMQGFHYTFKEMGGEILEMLWPPIGTTDYGPYLAQIPDGIDAVLANFSGGDALRFMKQYEEFGLKDKYPMIGCGTLTDEHVLVSMGDEAIGTITALHYSAALDTPENKAFASKYISHFGKIPSYYSEAAYTSGAALKVGLEGAGGLEDIKAFVQAIRSTPIVSARGPFTLDDYSCPIHNIYIRKVEKVDGQLQNTVIDTFENVSQFYKYDPAEFLARPVYSRDYPPFEK